MQASLEAPVSAVIVTYRSRQVVGRGLEALRPGFESGLIRCVVVDNCSPDGTADQVARDHPWVHLVRSPLNLGYGSGCNLGFQHVRSPYVFILNPDVVIDPASIGRLHRFMEDHPAAGMAMPATRIASGGYQPAGGTPTPWSMMAQAVGWGRAPSRQAALLPGTPPVKTDWLCGATLFIRSEAFRKVGGFDPRFFLYFEETDLCRRMRRMGYELWGVGEAVASHEEGASARLVDPAMKPGGTLPQHYFASRYYYLVKHHGRLAAALTEGVDLAFKGLRDLGRGLLRRPGRGELRGRLQAPVFRCPAIRPGVP